MFYRVRDDESGCEPRKLFNVVDFLMLDKNHSGAVDMDECITLLYSRYGKALVEDKLSAMKAENHKSVGPHTQPPCAHTRAAHRDVAAARARPTLASHHPLWRAPRVQLMVDAANEKNVGFSFFSEIHRRCKQNLIGTGIKPGATTVPQVNGLKFVADPKFNHLM